MVSCARTCTRICGLLLYWNLDLWTYFLFSAGDLVPCYPLICGFLPRFFFMTDPLYFLLGVGIPYFYLLLSILVFRAVGLSHLSGTLFSQGCFSARWLLSSIGVARFCFIGIDLFMNFGVHLAYHSLCTLVLLSICVWAWMELRLDCYFDTRFDWTFSCSAEWDIDEDEGSILGYQLAYWENMGLGFSFILLGLWACVWPVVLLQGCHRSWDCSWSLMR